VIPISESEHAESGESEVTAAVESTTSEPERQNKKRFFDKLFFLQVLLWVIVLLLILSGIAIFTDSMANPGLDNIYQTYY